MFVLIYELTLSRGLLLLLSFAEQKVISSNSKVASGIFTKDFMIVNSANEVQIIACTMYTKFVTPSVSDLYRVKRNYVFLVFQTVYKDIFLNTRL